MRTNTIVEDVQGVVTRGASQIICRVHGERGEVVGKTVEQASAGASVVVVVVVVVCVNVAVGRRVSCLPCEMNTNDRSTDSFHARTRSDPYP
jgi:hypothetical protein